MNACLVVAAAVYMVLASTSSSFSATVEADFMTLGREAKETFLKGNYRDAERLYQKAWEDAQAKDAPATDKAAILGGMAHVLLTQGRHPEAEKLFNRALEITAQEVVEPVVRPVL